ncbi:hypothetical protein SK3146_06843 [Paenibacillus konkukensis]|uniref:Uncharacterized protein n=1 Tax=Paenibacillus konkukensis TaxID=2020716 RepID=A0ABY4RY02_9BACL|nr:hypothetical protein [Paenibacillus konkukensis]UQZ87541.1 hypothetical protein SK3146_06843 [Paenibacillus konkukensis]
MMQVLRRVGERLRLVRIVPRLVIGYVLLICVPFSLFGLLFYHQMHNNMLEQYRAGKVSMMDRAHQNLDIGLTKVEALYPLFQNNTRLTKYLDGLNPEEWGDLYDYKKDIGPTFSYAYIGNQYLESVKMFKNDSTISILSPEIENRGNFQMPGQADNLKSLSPNKGIWVLDQGTDGHSLPALRYLHAIYNDTYTRELGLLQLAVSNSLVRQNLYDAGDGWGVQPEMNWKTQDGPAVYGDKPSTSSMLPPFANINAWSGIGGVKVSTNPSALQLVLFPGEEFEYIAVDLTVFKGDIIDGKMAVEEHFRKRFKYHDVSTERHSKASR